MTEIITDTILTNEDEGYDVEVSVGWTWVDNGIGAYEFWGTPSMDIRMELELEWFYIESISFDEEFSGGPSWTMERSEKDKYPELWAKVEAWVESEVENLDRPEIDYYDYGYDDE